VPLVGAVAWAQWSGPGAHHLWTELVVFRGASLRVLAASTSTAPVLRAHQLAGLAVRAGIVPLLTAGAVQVLRVPRAALRPVPVAAAALAVVDGVSVVLSGSFWAHYLLQTVPLCVVLAALLARPVRLTWGARPAVGSCVLSALLSLVPGQAAATVRGCDSQASGAVRVGAWLARHGQRGDTAVALYGSPDTLLGSGMALPYPYLWSLPVRTLDPGLRRLRAVLSGPEAVDWVVQVLPLHAWHLDPQRHLQRQLEQDYVAVAVVCGRRVLARRDQVLLRELPG
jgi:hypothetical protein